MAKKGEYSLPPEFWVRVVVSPDLDKCWTWKGCTNRKGYGTVVYRGVKWVASRLAYTLAVGDIPQGMMVLHSCDNPPCCNPKHLRPGTALDNTRDMWARNRAKIVPVRGSKHGNSVLTEEDVYQIKTMLTGKRGEYEPLARMYGVTKTAIQHIAYGITWRHIELRPE